MIAGAFVLTGPASGATQHPLVIRLRANAPAAIDMAVGLTRTFRSDTSFTDLVAGDPDIADVVPLTDQSFYVQARKLGTTTIAAYRADRSLAGLIEVQVGYNTPKLQSELRRRISGAHIRASSVNGQIMVSGTVPDVVTLQKAVDIAKQFGGQVINDLSVSQPQQVMLEVRFLEASKNIGRDLGIEWNASGHGMHLTTGSGGAAGVSPPFGAVLANILAGGVSADLLVQALEGKGLARRLAEPNLIAMSGQTASFLAGGEFPFPVQGDQGRITVEFRKFGVGLTFLPVVLGNGLINLKIEPEVSQLDATNSISTGTISVPGLVVRRASTTVELRDGQSFAIAGLLQITNSESARQLPWLGDVPVLGALFRSASFERHETELAIIVTPHLVRPSAPIQRLRSPLDSALPANDIDRFLFGRQEVALAPPRAPEIEGTQSSDNFFSALFGRR
jgi:pilus assembly protein CpaC